MVTISRRSLLSAGAALAGAAALPRAIARAAAIAPDRRTGTIRDVEHVVILMQENRGFDHYFGTMRGVRGFGDRFPMPVASSDGEPRSVWQQLDRKAEGGPRLVSPFHLDTDKEFALMRMAGTPHTWPDAQAAWDEGRMAHWPEAKQQRSMGHYARADLPFQFALAEAFTICDAYHCAIQTGTNTNRLFLWSGTNDPFGRAGGPAISNSHDSFAENGGAADPYRWTTVPERMQAAGIDWRIYQDMADNFTDNPLVGFAAFRDAHHGKGDPALKDRAITTRGLDMLKADVLAGRLPQVSYIIATAAGSEHPGPSSPAQGAAYTAEVLDALTADPKVWARTALFVMFDENDGFFDHVPPPAPPSRGDDGQPLGGSTVDLTGEYHDVPSTGDADVDKPAYRGRPYGLGPRVPMYVVSPWSRGGWVNSEVFDHTSVIRFLETRFGFYEPNISAWRRAICGDLTSAFDFAATDAAAPLLPDPREDAVRAAAIKGQVAPLAPATPGAPAQEPGIRRARPLSYRLEVTPVAYPEGIRLRFRADGAGAVFHVYDRHALDRIPRRYTLAKGSSIEDVWPSDPATGHDLWVLGPNGFHRHFAGRGTPPLVEARVEDRGLSLTIPKTLDDVMIVRLEPGKAPPPPSPLPPGRHHWPLDEAMGWYDVTLTRASDPSYRWRLAGRHDRPGRVTVSDPFRA
ncbi:phosphocholine-specific phospholipase C [Sphingomonas sanguinis]|jgi:phospholipase C|uniref:phospholipase C n=1 Tax=Sphingomonas sanguinis TaxID=33051 RepID=A0A7Y7UPK6_9SPHN|nr:phospholipase C, phosphocholine-specific [Sphingomonas sanguinis]MBZ6381060.1 phospholipase C, phosphocholine-specific [Sphingomonas sanguinis]NNG49187.1 phospholipase C, phosphocholine-specific [Sphingomonas sanguinis]NNG55286.1 phospholipase C, phosphocholine-specific [Sphingomonas sanguinis]NVP30362.1 phospholipase C, phosphocholine-specific [Sphingomonas sanguinis]